MALSSDLISQFVKVTQEDTKKSSESTVYGTASVDLDGKTWVQLDGSDRLTPVSTTAAVENDERVTVLIKNHTATIVGNVTTPSASSTKVEKLDGKISEFDVVVSHRVTTDELNAINATIENLVTKIGKFENIEATTAEIESLKAKLADVEYLSAKDIEAINANIDSIQATFGDFQNISTEDLNALNAEIQTLKGYSADFTYVSTDALEAVKANIKQLDTDKLSTKDAEIKYATIDFANINQAAVQKLFTDSGIIKDLVVSEGKITGELVGVTIKGDLIEGNTIKADKLVVKGSDGLYYKLNLEGGATTSEQVTAEDLQNGLSGSIIVAKSITAEKVAVDDLVAFGATIGGFHITTNSIYSGVKASIQNYSRGIYLDNDGQVSFGDVNNYLRYYRDTDGRYKLAIVADDITFGTSGKSVEETINDTLGNVEIGSRNLIRNSATMIFDGYFFDEPNDGLLGAAVLGEMKFGDDVAITSEEGE